MMYNRRHVCNYSKNDEEVGNQDLKCDEKSNKCNLISGFITLMRLLTQSTVDVIE